MDNLENSLPRGFAIPFYKSEKGNERPRSKEEPPQNRVPFLDWMPDSWRNHLIAMMGEFVGTFLFLFFAFSGTQVAFNGEPNSSNNSSKVPNPLILFYVSVSFGFSLLVNVWVFFRISGGMFNPAVTLGMALIGAVPYWRSLWVFIAQIIGGIASAGVVSCLFPGPLAVQTTLGGSTSVVQGLFIEMFLTAELVFTIFMLAAEKHKSTFLAPMGIGLSLFIAELSGVYFTGGSLNPTRSFGPAVIDRNFPGYHWIYWVGPILGALLASGFYKFCKMVEYETANPGQDLDDKEAQVFNPDESIERPSVSAAEPDYVTDAPSKMGGGIVLAPKDRPQKVVGRIVNTALIQATRATLLDGAKAAIVLDEARAIRTDEAKPTLMDEFRDTLKDRDILKGNFKPTLMGKVQVTPMEEAGGTEIFFIQ
ncbi:MAG: hypothetical protein M1819_003746 [Sarea resinae]|nr:MAG: hypothetical protein M1819_003746 [Sarea resinae]